MPATNGTAPKRGRNKQIDEATLAAATEASRKLGEKQQQAAKPAAGKKGAAKAGDKAAKPAAKKGAAKAGDKAGKPAPFKKGGQNAIGKQGQSAPAGAVGKQGADTSGKRATGEVRGGTNQVLITEAAIGGRGGRPPQIEDYPFGDLTPARKQADGTIVGPSFFIPSSDSADGKLAAARKRHKDKATGRPALFWSRKRREQINGEGPEVPGLRIWRGTPELAGEV